MNKAFLRALAVGSALLVLSLSAAAAAGIYQRAVPSSSLLEDPDGRYLALRTGSLDPGTSLEIYADGEKQLSASVEEDRETILGPLPTEKLYTILAGDMVLGSFYFYENASVEALSGSLRDDGEFLYTDTGLDRVLSLTALP